MSLLVAIPILSHQRQERRDCRGIRGGDAGEHCSTGGGCSTCPAGTAKAPLAVTPLTLYLYTQKWLVSCEI